MRTYEIFISTACRHSVVISLGLGEQVGLRSAWHLYKQPNLLVTADVLSYQPMHWTAWFLLMCLRVPLTAAFSKISLSSFAAITGDGLSQSL